MLEHDPDRRPITSKLRQWLESQHLVRNSHSLSAHREGGREQLRAARAAPGRKKLSWTGALMALAAVLILVGWALSMKQQLALLGVQMSAGAGLAHQLLHAQLPVGTLLWWDTLAIFVYTALVARARSALVHFAERRHALPAWASQNLPRVLAGIYVSDLIENLATGLSLATAGEASVVGLPGTVFTSGFGVLALIACWVKLVSIALSVLAVPGLLIHGLRRRSVPRPGATAVGDTSNPGAKA